MERSPSPKILRLNTGLRVRLTPPSTFLYFLLSLVPLLLPTFFQYLL